jgi:hypothetical protein
MDGIMSFNDDIDRRGTGWSEEICNYAPYCLYKGLKSNILLRVIDDFWDAGAQCQDVKLEIVKTREEIIRSFHWMKQNCERLNEMEVLAWAAK